MLSQNIPPTKLLSFICFTQPKKNHTKKKQHKNQHLRKFVYHQKIWIMTDEIRKKRHTKYKVKKRVRTKDLSL